jgi:hypothetical protein
MIKKAMVGAGLAGLAAAALFGSMPIANATHVAPVVISGNPSCDGGLKIEPVVDGTFDGVTIDVTNSSFSFTTDGSLVTSVIVKGGPNANLYSYSPGVTSDEGLTAPIRSGTATYGLSHLCFFLDGKTPPPPK